MSIYTSEKVAHYVYMCVHKTTGQFYIGSRTIKNRKLPSHLDFPIYKTSSKYVKPMFDEFDWHIVAEFERADDAYDTEQYIIYENWTNHLILNKSCFHDAKQRFKAPTGIPKSAEFKMNLSIARKGIPQGPNPKKALPGLLNGMHGRTRTPEEIEKIKVTRATHTRQDNIKSYSRIKTKDELQKLKNNGSHNILVCRISDHKEMNIGNFFKYQKEQHKILVTRISDRKVMDIGNYTKYVNRCLVI